LLSGKPPFDGKSDNEITQKVMSGKYSMSDPIWEEISDSAKSLIHSMLDLNHDTRVSAREAL